MTVRKTCPVKQRFALCLAFLILVSVLFAQLPAQAQADGSSLLITEVDTSAFPEISAYLAVDGATGQNLSSLPTRAFSLAENGVSLADFSVNAEEVGVQVVFVLDTSPAFKARDANGVTRLEHIRHALADFARGQDGTDDVTVLAPESALVSHSRQGGEVVTALGGYITDYAGAADPFPLVSQALDFASDASPRPGMRRYLVLISNGLNAQATPLDDLVARARAAQVAILTVFVGPAGDEVTTSARRLGQLAGLTQGTSLVFDRPDSLAPLFQSFAAQRTQYRLTYHSALAETGQHRLTARVKLADGQELISDEAVFPLRVEPPAVSLVNVPTAIQRAGGQPGADGRALAPAAYEIAVKVEFPDGHVRQLREATLWVDGEKAVTRSARDIGSFTWPLTDYAESGAHTLQARIVDELGLIAESEVLTVTVSLEAASAAAPAPLPESRGWLWPLLGTLTVVGLAGGGAWLWARYRRRGPQRDSQPATSPPLLTVTQPFRPLGQSKPAAPRLTLPQLPRVRRAARGSPRGPAYLEVLESGGGGAPREAIEILSAAVKLGRDPTVADVTFPEHSVSRLHAHIAETAPGVYQIFDEGSTSGTWVNFTQIPAEGGQVLKDRDVVNLGRVQLRFKQRATPPAQPVDRPAVPLTPQVQPPGPETKPENGRETAQPAPAAEEHKPG